MTTWNLKDVRFDNGSNLNSTSSEGPQLLGRREKELDDVPPPSKRAEYNDGIITPPSRSTLGAERPRTSSLVGEVESPNTSPPIVEAQTETFDIPHQTEEPDLDSQNILSAL